MNPWSLPRQAVFGGVRYDLNADFRDILELMGYLADPDVPELFRWRIALALFYRQPIPQADTQQALSYLSDFLQGGSPQPEQPAPRLLDWQQDADLIISDVNRVCGQEIRALPFVHWWTFLSWFHAIGQGQLSVVVGLRDKLRRGKKLEGWEQEFYRENRRRVELPKRRSREEDAQRDRLNRLLGP